MACGGSRKRQTRWLEPQYSRLTLGIELTWPTRHRPVIRYIATRFGLWNGASYTPSSFPRMRESSAFDASLDPRLRGDDNKKGPFWPLGSSGCNVIVYLPSLQKGSWGDFLHKRWDANPPNPPLRKRGTCILQKRELQHPCAQHALHIGNLCHHFG